MSWDLIVFSADTLVSSDADGCASFTDDWVSPDIGEQKNVRQKISQAFPKTDWSDQSWGILIGEDYSLEFSLGAERTINTFSIHSRGAATPAVLQLIAETDWKILDVQTIKWLNGSDNPDEGRQKFQNYLDTVVEKHYAPQKRGFFQRLFGR